MDAYRKKEDEEKRRLYRGMVEEEPKTLLRTACEVALESVLALGILAGATYLSLSTTRGRAPREPASDCGASPDAASGLERMTNGSLPYNAEANAFTRR